jgi:MoxR-like ATPase
MLMAASNEFPQDQDGGKELAAMFDRFLFRKKLGYVSEAGRRELLKRSVGNEWGPCRFSQHVTMSEVDSAHDEAKLMPWSTDAKRSMWAILEELEKEKVHPGDRRITKSVMAARSYAYLCGADEVEPEHLDILAHILWDDPVEQPEKCERVVSKLANPLKTAINSLRVQAADVMTSNPPGEVKIKKLEAIRDQLVILKDNPLKAYAKDQVEEMVKQSYYELAGVKS